VIQLTINDHRCHCTKCDADLQMTGIGLMAPISGALGEYGNSPCRVLCPACAVPFQESVNAAHADLDAALQRLHNPLSACCGAPTFVAGNERICDQCRCSRPL